MPNDFFDSQNEEGLKEDGFSSVKPFGTEESKKKSNGKLDWSKIDWTQADLPVQPIEDLSEEALRFKNQLINYVKPEEPKGTFVSTLKQPFSRFPTTEEGRMKKGVTYIIQAKITLSTK